MNDQPGHRFDWATIAPLSGPTADDVTIVDGVVIDSNEKVQWLLANFVDPDRDDLDASTRATILRYRDRFAGIPLADLDH